jgi:transcription antitermination protein NusB
MSRRLAREIAFKTLFQYDVGNNDVEPALSEMLDESGLSGESARFARELAEGAASNKAAIDNELSRHLVGWTLSRLAGVDRSILRLAAYELLYRDDIPGAVTINEALEITKKFHSEEASKFINGILDNIARSKERAEVE